MKIELVDTTEFSHVVSTVYAHSNVICMESLAPELFVSLTDVFILFWFVRNTTADYGNILLWFGLLVDVYLNNSLSHM